MEDTRPQLSIVIASVNGRPYLDECLRALRRQRGEVRAEVIVADGVGAEVRSFVEAEHPEVHLIACDGPRSVPALRSAGILASQGEIVVLTEDHCIPAEDWYESLLRAHGRWPGPAIGGAVDNAATGRTVDWAVFFCEYSNFMTPLPEGIVHDLPGPNLSYKRSALEEMDDLVRGEYWETFLHWRLEERGHRLWSDPSIRVLHKKHFRFFDFLAERYHYGRAFAGTRTRFVSPGRRWFYFAFSPALPALLAARIGRRSLARRRHRAAFARALPMILLFMLAWAAGEWVGYAWGPGQSALRLR
ncbi:MAG TPA: glycosyltransferase [Thermoanaerobaculia bacterium]|jgi:GT2 family glycosyltransferase|nr:glycosyltransferase [Thermoanaerobaculia bacterium]